MIKTHCLNKRNQFCYQLKFFHALFELVVYSFLSFWFGCPNLTRFYHNCREEIRSKSAGFGPSMQILIRPLKQVADTEAQPSILILFFNKIRCSSLAFETGRTNISSMSNKTKSHSLLRLELNIWCHIFL